MDGRNLKNKWNMVPKEGEWKAWMYDRECKGKLYKSSMRKSMTIEARLTRSTMWVQKEMLQLQPTNDQNRDRLEARWVADTRTSHKRILAKKPADTAKAWDDIQCISAASNSLKRMNNLTTTTDILTEVFLSNIRLQGTSVGDHTTRIVSCSSQTCVIGR